jgi:putative acetyltransferase
MRVRAERPDDERAVDQVITAAFVDDGSLIVALVHELRKLVAADAGSSLVAEDDGLIVGHVMFTRSLLDAPPRLLDVRVLSPLSVTPDRQRQGIGGDLVRNGLHEMRRQRVPIVFLEGHPGYYPRFGFAPGQEQGFRKPSLRIPDSAFMALRLESYEPWMTGTLVYAHEFWDFDAVGLRDAAR